MPIVEVEGQEIEFPDTMSNEEIKSVLDAKFSKAGRPENLNADILGLPPEMQEDIAQGNEFQDAYSTQQIVPQVPIQQELEPQPEIPQGNIGSQTQAGVYGFNKAVPFGSSITSGIGAGIVKGADLLGLIDERKSFGELYSQALKDTKATEEAYPLTSLVGTIGGIGTTLPMASAKVLSGAKPTQGVRGLVNEIPQALAKVGNFARGGKTGQSTGTLSKAIRGGVVSAPVGALYGAGEADEGQRTQGAISGGGLGAGVGATLPIVGAGLTGAYLGSKNIVKGLGARGVDELKDVSQAIKDTSQQAYQAVKDAGFELKPKALNNIAMNIEKDLIDDGKLNRRLHNKVIGVLRDFRKEAKQNNMSIDELDQWRQVFGDIASNFNDPAQARKARIAMNSLDTALDDLSVDSVGNLGQETLEKLATARQEWKRQAKFNTVLEVLENSGGDGNKLRRDMEKLLTTKSGKKKIRSFSKEEKDLLKQITTQTTGESALKMMGKFGFDVGSARAVGNTALPLLGAGAAYGGGGAGLGLAVPAIGTASRKGYELVGKAKVDKLLKLIESGGKPSTKEVMALPPKDAKNLLELLKAQSVNIEQQTDRIK